MGCAASSGGNRDVRFTGVVSANPLVRGVSTSESTNINRSNISMHFSDNSEVAYDASWIEMGGSERSSRRSRSERNSDRSRSSRSNKKRAPKPDARKQTPSPARSKKQTTTSGNSNSSSRSSTRSSKSSRSGHSQSSSRVKRVRAGAQDSLHHSGSSTECSVLKSSVGYVSDNVSEGSSTSTNHRTCISGYPQAQISSSGSDPDSTDDESGESSGSDSPGVPPYSPPPRPTPTPEFNTPLALSARRIGMDEDDHLSASHQSFMTDAQRSIASRLDESACPDDFLLDQEDVEDEQRRRSESGLPAGRGLGSLARLKLHSRQRRQEVSSLSKSSRSSPGLVVSQLMGA
eukprot:Hpha_TRINITY_DN14654_c0_g2::TRINITY_DN14654_c0_g2_i1::g.48260::m.48260